MSSIALVDQRIYPSKVHLREILIATYSKISLTLLLLGAVAGAQTRIDLTNQVKALEGLVRYPKKPRPSGA